MKENNRPALTLTENVTRVRGGREPRLPLATFDEVWGSVAATALITYLKPGSPIWLQLVGIFMLPSTTTFQIGVAVTPGSTWNSDFQTFAVELVRVLASPSDPGVLPPTRTRIRVFRYLEPIVLNMLRNVSPIVPDVPCIEVLRIDDKISIDIRGMHNIDLLRWQDEIQLLLRGVTLLTTDDSISEAQLRYETEVSAAIERMAQRHSHKSVPPRFTKTEFKEHWPFKMSRANLYNVIPEERWPDIERQYYHRCRELRRTTAQ
jgi:hypothetical protein